MKREATWIAPPPRPSVYTRVRSAVESGGLRHAFGRGLKRIAAPLGEVGALVLFVRDLEAPLARAAAADGYRAREASAAEVERVREGSDPGRSAEALLERFRRGHLCFIAEDPGGNVVHTRWVTPEAPYLPEARRELVLAPGDVYFYDGFTRPEARRRGVDGLTRCAIFEAMRARGFTRAVSYVRADNPAGLRAAGRWQQRLGQVRYLRLGRGRPRLLGAPALAPLAFAPEAAFEVDEEERSARARSWREWFEGWLEAEPARRSIGFSALPEESFVATAGFIAATLDLDPGADRVLDVGCASGAVSRRLAERCRRLTGVDAVAGLVADASRAGIRSGGGPAGFLAADGRLLPFADGAFDKVCCTGMIHTLPSPEDGLKVVRELVRVCRPGGRVLVGAVPDRARRLRVRAEVWRRGGARQRLELVAALLLPAPVRAALRRLTGARHRHRLVALDYDLAALARRLQPLDLDCRLVPYPPDFWSRDFRTTRSNLLITLPERPAAIVLPAAPWRSGPTPRTGRGGSARSGPGCIPWERATGRRRPSPGGSG